MTPEDIAKQIILATGGSLKRIGEATALVKQYGYECYHEGRAQGPITETERDWS